MGKLIRVLLVAVLCFASVVPLQSWAETQTSAVESLSKNIVVEIDYGDVKPSRTVEVSRDKDRTVLEILQTIAVVETHPVGQYAIVTSIDDVKGERGKMAWYYTVDGQSVDKIAYSKMVDGIKHVKWTYKKDVCSKKVGK